MTIDLIQQAVENNSTCKKVLDYRKIIDRLAARKRELLFVERKIELLTQLAEQAEQDILNQYYSL